MRLPLDWLAELVDLPADAELVERLSLCGFEDVEVIGEGPDLSAVRVGLVTKCSQHPNADKLSVCTVDVGDGEPRTIVCGAPNVAADQKVAVALPGTRLPDGTKLKRTKLRGVASEGMICSRRELGLGDEHEGILVLDPQAEVGAPLPEVLPPAQRVLEVGITPNRGDAASALGLAREIQAIFGGPLRMPETRPPESGSPAADAIAIEVARDGADGCFHYAGRVVRGVTVAPSPDWLQQRLEAAGLRPINCVVDVTNLVLLELGQPLHAFDLSKLRGQRIVVRRAARGERITTLDDQDRALDPEDLVIADGEGPVAIAGVMGGADSEVGSTTRDVLIESAHFDPTRVRRTARRHGLHSEASYRFERGVDRGGITRAADRAARLLAELAGGEVARGVVEARGAAAPHTEQIRLEVARANRLLGTDIGRDEAAALLERVGIDTTPDGAGALRACIPSHRNDLHLPEDLVEEIARIHGYERIPVTLPVAELCPVTRPPTWDLADRAKDLLAAEGLLEAMSFPFLAEKDLAALRLDPKDPRRAPLRLRNPIQEGEPLLRPLLAPSLLRLAHQNRSRQVDRVALFEVCRVFIPQGEPPGGSPPVRLADEPLTLGVLLLPGEDRHLWGPETPPPLFHRLRGIAERLLTGLGYVASLRSGGSVSYLHPGAQAEICVTGRSLGSLGELHPAVAADFGIDAPCALLELDLSALARAGKRDVRFREVSREPAIRRDVAALLDEQQSAGEVLEAIRKAAGADLVSVDLFDRYEGKGVPEGRVSLAFRLVFQRGDRTLSDAEVGKSMDRVVRTLTSRFGAELR